MTGMIQGGWEFVWSVYGITWGGLVLYAWQDLDGDGVEITTSNT